ncbi:MAG: carboxypeptidase-like regulatory domain-containing protein [Candidatus Acidiferrales bacterium]
MRRPVGACALLAVAVAFWAAPLRAQESAARTVRGQVLDENERPVERALVHLTNLGTKKRLSVATDKEGRYQFNDVSRKGDFELVAELGERKSRTRKLSQFDSRSLVFVHLKLEPAKKKEEPDETTEKKDKDD